MISYFLAVLINYPVKIMDRKFSTTTNFRVLRDHTTFFLWFISCAIRMFPYMGTRYEYAQDITNIQVNNSAHLLSYIMPACARLAQRCPKWRHVMTSVNAGSGLINIMISDGKTGFDCVCPSVRCVHAFLSRFLQIVLLRSVCTAKPRRNIP